MDEPTLIDFDCQVKVTISNSHLSTIRRPLTMLAVTLKFSDGSKREKILELDEAAIDKVLEQCTCIAGALA